MNKPDTKVPSFDGFSQEDWDEVSDNPELTPEELAALWPASEVLPPALYAALTRASGEAADAATIRLDADVLAHFRATGPGWQARINDALRANMKAA